MKIYQIEALQLAALGQGYWKVKLELTVDDNGKLISVKEVKW